jgi:hypothetical protein
MRATICLFAVVVSSPAWAQQSGEQPRAEAAATALDSGRIEVGAFRVQRRRDAFDDVDGSYIFNRGSNEKLSIGWLCVGRNLQVVFLHSYLGGDRRDRIAVRHRLDQGAATDFELWRLEPSGMSTRMPRELVRDFTERALRATSLRVRIVDPLDNQHLDSEFSLAGLRDALSYLPCYNGQSHRDSG